MLVLTTRNPAFALKAAIDDLTQLATVRPFGLFEIICSLQAGFGCETIHELISQHSHANA